MTPKVSVIIPAYNEAKLLKNCLASLQKQTFPKDQFEVIVVDNNSKDDTAKVAKELGVKVYTYAEIQGCGASRKFGATKAKGEILAFTDADSSPETDWLQRINTLLSDKYVFVAGSAVPDKKSFVNSFTYSYFDVLHGSHFMLGKPLVGGYNMAITRKAYDAIGGINSALLSCDDWDLSIRAGQKFGRSKVKYDTKLRVVVSTRKLNSGNVFFKFMKDGIANYKNIVLLNKREVKPTFEVR